MAYDLTKRFNLGLNLDASLLELEEFLNRYCEFITSIYFSLPLGLRYYSRTSLEKEYEENRERFFDAQNIIKNKGIKLEVTFNTELHDEELERGIEFILKYNINPQEIVCMNSSVQTLKTAFPKAKMISSYCNGYTDVSEIFDAVVLGQHFLRNEEKRHYWISKGYEIILLLNNGCSFECMHKNCNAQICRALYNASLERHSKDEIYAIQSFFPVELKSLIERDKYSRDYIFKISNRPLGLEYTKKALYAYLNFIEYTEEDFKENPKNYALFGALTELCKRVDSYHYSAIMEAKKEFIKME